MVVIEIQKDFKDFTPFVGRCFAILVTALCIVIKISDPNIAIAHVLIGTLGLLVMSEMNNKIPSQLKNINVSDSDIEFVYVKGSSRKLILSLVRDGDIQINRSVLTGRLRVSSGINSIDLPWPCGKQIESKLREVFASIHNNSSHSPH